MNFNIYYMKYIKENIKTQDFKKEKDKFIEELDKFRKSYDNYLLYVNVGNLRSVTTPYQEIKKLRNYVLDSQKIDSKQVEHMIDSYKDFDEQDFVMTYFPELSKLLKSKVTIHPDIEKKYSHIFNMDDIGLF